MSDTQPAVYMFCIITCSCSFSPFQRLIMFLKIGSVFACFIAFGKVDQNLFPRKDIVAIPKVVVCAFGSCESLLGQTLFCKLPQATVDSFRG